MNIVLFHTNSPAMIFIILIGFMILGFAVQAQLKRRFKQYQTVPIDNGLTGRDIARKMLDDHGLQNVNITAVEGRLTDHYNPRDSSVNLSQDVYHGNHVAAAAIAAHECGHAVQHATKYEWLDLRTGLVPIVNASGKLMNIVFFASLFGMGMLGLGFKSILLFLIAAQAIIASFALVTLPVEYDASRRALVWLQDANVTNSNNHGMAQDALKWAARTYVVAAAAAVTQLLYYVMLYMVRR